MHLLDILMYVVLGDALVLLTVANVLLIQMMMRR